MRSKPLFTPSDLRRFETLGRGIGTYEKYIPWHRVNRSDPSSMGRSHLQIWHGRQRELLSDQELVSFLFSTMHPHVVDIREQFPLNLRSAWHELSAYRIDSKSTNAPGTIELADRMKIKHPVVRDAGGIAPWILTTDLVLTLWEPEGKFQLLAISVKPANAWQAIRSRTLLALEREYWFCRKVEWLLITPTLYHVLVADMLKGSSSWALGSKCDMQFLHWFSLQSSNFHGKDLTYILAQATAQSGCKESAQNAFWQALWTGCLTFDLRRSWRPSAPFNLISKADFWSRNPIVSGRSAWPA